MGSPRDHQTTPDEVLVALAGQKISYSGLLGRLAEAPAPVCGVLLTLGHMERDGAVRLTNCRGKRWKGGWYEDDGPMYVEPVRG